VYIVGDVAPSGGSSPSTVPVYWKDGTMIPLTLSSTYTNGWALGITEDSSGNIYVVGGQWNNSSTIQGYWKNSTFTTLPTGGNSFVYDNNIAVDTSGNVWVLGLVGNSSPPTTVVYWKNGAGPTTISGFTSVSFVGADASGHVYFTGVEGINSSTWTPWYSQNGSSPTEFSLSPTYTNGYAFATALDTSGNFYISGGVWSATASIPNYWKATGGTWGAPSALNIVGSPYSTWGYWDVGGLAVDSSGNIDAFAFAGPSSTLTTLVYWKGASSNPTALSLNGNAYFNVNNGGLLAVDAQGNVFIANSLGASSTATTPIYWENGGTPVSLPMGSGNTYGQANGIVVGP